MAKKTNEVDGLVDAGRAAELIGYSYNAIVKAIYAELLPVQVWFERKGGSLSPLIKKSDLEQYRATLVKRYETMPQHSKRLSSLKNRSIL